MRGSRHRTCHCPGDFSILVKENRGLIMAPRACGRMAPCSACSSYDNLGEQSRHHVAQLHNGDSGRLNSASLVHHYMHAFACASSLTNGEM